MWLYYPMKVAIIINIVLAVFLAVFVKNGYEIYNKLYVKEEDAVTGQFKDFTAYENIHDLDQNKMNKSPTRVRSGSDLPRNSLGKLEIDPKNPNPNQQYIPRGGENPFEL